MTITASSSPHGAAWLSPRDEESLALVVVGKPGDTCAGVRTTVLERSHPVHCSAARLRAKTSGANTVLPILHGQPDRPGWFGHNPSPNFKERL